MSPEEQLALMKRATGLLASSRNFDETMAHTIASCLPALADFGFFDLDVGGSVTRTARAHDDPRIDEILAPTRWIRQERTDMNLCALSTGRAGIHADIDDAWYQLIAVNEGHLAVLRSLAFVSMITVPMRYQGTLLGALTLFYGSSGRHYGDAELDAATDLAALAAPVVANARLIEQQRRVGEALEVARGEAEAASRAKDEFLAMLGHELRNPLAPIVTALHLMEMRDASTFRKERDVIQRQVDHMVRLVDDLLDIARIARGKVSLVRERIDLVEVVKTTADASREQLDAQQLELALVVPDEPVFVDADRVRIAQVVGNLLANAAKFSPPGERVEVEVVVADGEVEVVVRDRGAGIEPDLLPRVFDMFVQGPQNLARERGGLGVGLAIVANLVAFHGGRVAVESEGIGRGATFRFWLPCA